MGQILDCILDAEGKNRHFLFEGDVEMGDEISFYHLEVKEVEDETVTPFVITAKTWAGLQLTPYDAIGDVLSKYTRGATDFHLISMYEPLKIYLDELKKDCVIVGDKAISQKIVYDSFFNEYELMYATDQYIYYTEFGDSYLMLATDSIELLATNFFAECGYLDSVENVASDKEVLLYCVEEPSEDADVRHIPITDKTGGQYDY